MLRLLLAVLAISLAGCALDLETDVDEQPIVGGVATPSYPGVLLVGSRCTGTLITPRIVLTAAHCGIGPGDRAEVMNIETPVSSHRVTAAHTHRLYNDQGGVASADVTVALLEDAPPVAAFAYPTDVQPSLLSQPILGVGFGLNVPGQSGFGTKREATFLVDYVNDEILQGEGINGESVCSGDSGGPAFDTAGSELTIVGIARSTFDGCRTNSTWTRVDTYAASFIVPAIDALEGPCAFDGDCVESGCRTPDPDCAPCGLDGVCSSGCQVVDLDCPRKSGFNTPCSVDDDCESLLCAERDGGDASFCSRECGVGASCPDQAACESRPEGDICVPRALVDTGGCGCESGGGGGGWLVLLALVGLRGSRQRR